MGRVRLMLAFLALFAVTAAPLVMPAIAATVPMEHCGDGHGKAPPGDHGQAAMDHQACCVAVDPGVAGGARFGERTLARLPYRLFTTQLTALAASGTDPPPPRLT